MTHIKDILPGILKEIAEKMAVINQVKQPEPLKFKDRGFQRLADVVPKIKQIGSVKSKIS